MNCTKCGRETAEDAVFCKKCLAVMAQYPVKPGTVIQLPQRKALTKKPASRKKLLPPEELVISQRKTIKWLWVMLIATFLLLFLSVSLLFQNTQKQESTSTIGQNYRTRDTTDR